MPLQVRPSCLMASLPRFLIADDLDTPDIYVIHTQFPRFTARVVTLEAPDGTSEGLDPIWTDGPPADPDAPEVIAAMRDAAAFYARSKLSDSRSLN